MQWFLRAPILPLGSSNHINHLNPALVWGGTPVLDLVGYNHINPAMVVGRNACPPSGLLQPYKPYNHGMVVGRAPYPPPPAWLQPQWPF
jgi:hypothetical protein